VGYGLAQRLEEGFGALEVLLLSAYHDREGPLCRPDVAPADRRVEHTDPSFAGGPGQLPGQGRRGGAHVHDERALSGSLQEPRLSGHGLLDLRRSGEHGDGNGALSGNLGGTVGYLSPSLRRQLLGLPPGAVVEHQLVARPHEVAGHRSAHDPQSHEADSVRHLGCSR
jgi:hypothetical protein